MAAQDDKDSARVGTHPGESKGTRSYPLRKMLAQGRAGLAQLVQPSQERASQIWLVEEGGDD